MNYFDRQIVAKILSELRITLWTSLRSRIGIIDCVSGLGPSHQVHRHSPYHDSKLLGQRLDRYSNSGRLHIPIHLLGRR